MSGTVTLFRPVGKAELDLIAEAGYCSFPPRLSTQPIFYPVLNREYAVKIARDWNTKDKASGFAGYVTQFELEADFASRYERQVVGTQQHEELWVPAEDLAEFNRHIVGPIVVVETFQGPNSG
jgi:hypothetical protein